MKQKLIAEWFGTATLAFAMLTAMSAATPLLTTPIVAGLVLLLFVYSVGSISGAHLNPAVTVGVWAIKKITSKEAILYVVAQCLGGFTAFLLAFYLFDNIAVGFTTESYSDFWGELIGMTIFSFGIASVIYKKTELTASGLVIGGSFTLGILLAMTVGATGILNPAVGITLGMVSLGNIAGAIFGSIIGMHLYRFLVR